MLPTVSGAPMTGARNPASRLPTGGAPMNIIRNRLITRPRRRSGARVCNKVLVADRGTMNPEPTSGRTSMDSQKRSDHAKSSSPSPKRTSASAMTRPRVSCSW